MDQPSDVPPYPDGQLLIYKDDGLNLRVRLDGQTVWLTQASIADLFQTTPQNITLHLQRIYEDGELLEQATCKEYLQVRTEGARQVEGSRCIGHNINFLYPLYFDDRTLHGGALFVQ